MQMNLPAVVRHYNEPGRHYHNMTHIRRLYSRANNMGIQLTDAQRVAILFHDVIYDPKSKTNEEDSVTRMYELCRPESDTDVKAMADASKIILLTKQHVSANHEQAIMLDLDLHELGESWLRFAYNDSNIRKEYSFATDEQWIEGRGNFMAGLLKKEYIFNTKLFREIYEEPARINIKMLLTELGKSWE